MAGHRTYPLPTLAILALLAVAPAARGVDILRLQPTADRAQPITLWGTRFDTWTDGAEQVYEFTGQVQVTQGGTTVRAERAVVWVEQDVLKKRRPGRVVVYADTVGDKPVGIESAGGPRRTAEAVVVEFTAPAVGWVRGQERQQSRADGDYYRQALAARGWPVPPLKGDTVVSTQFQTPGKGEPTDTSPDLPTPAVTGTTIIPVPLTQTRTIWIAPRTNRPFNIYPVLAGKEKAAIITGGIKLAARFTSGALRSLEMEADQVVIWQTGGDSTSAVSAMSTEDGAEGADGIEVYLCGNVIVRYGGEKDLTPQGTPKEARTLRADRVYYDVSNHKAIAHGADLEYTREGFANTGHMVAREVHQLSSTEFTGFDAILHASRLPSDPAFVVAKDQADVYKMPRTARRTIFGLPFRDRQTGQIVEEEPTMLESRNMTLRVLGVPVFWLPRFRTNLNDPLGPFEGLTFRQDRIFGYQLYASWDMLELVGLTPLEGERWSLLTDYLSLRGPALGTVYTRSSPTFMGMQAPYQASLKAYGLNDQGTDQIGGPRSNVFQPEAPRGRILGQYQQYFTLLEPDDVTFQAQAAFLSDRNFLEQYFNNEYNFGPNQETFAWVKYQRGNSAFTLLGQADTGQYWINRTYWTPRADAFLLGQSLFERLTYHTWGSVGYAQLDTFRLPDNEYPTLTDNGFPPPERQVNAARLDWMHRISAPFDLGPARVVPYGVFDLAYYSDSNRFNSQGRIYGGGGMKASVPFSRLYPDVCSELFDVQGLYHKNTFAVNYFLAGSNVSWAVLPEFDRLNDEATQNAVRDITPWQTTFVNLGPEAGQALQLGSYNKFNPRMYAIRRLIDSRADTLDDIQVIQTEWRQRLQTKRGYPGLEHTVDWLTLDLSASLFPASHRDNFGTLFGFVEAHLMWNVGDRTNLFSNIWYDPFDYGGRYWEVGTNFSRDDRTAFTLSYKEVQPLASRLVVASATYNFSPKYSITGVTAYDFGYNESLTNSLLFTRIGTDLQITVGFTYNSIVQNFGFTLNVIPNLFASQATAVGQPGTGGLGGSGSAVRGR